jgi:hypothetical protein
MHGRRTETRTGLSTRRLLEGGKPEAEGYLAVKTCQDRVFSTWYFFLLGVWV